MVSSTVDKHATESKSRRSFGMVNTFHTYPLRRREVQIMYERIPEELRHELDRLSPDKVVSVLEALNRLHRTMEAEVYELALRLVQAVC
jgi:hypothetical protein